MGNFLIFKGFRPTGLVIYRRKLSRKKNPRFRSTTYFYYKNVSNNGTFIIKKIAKFSLGVIKLAHLLYKRRTFISNQGGQKPPQNQNISRYDPTIKMLLKMGGDWVFSAKFRLGTMKSTHLLCKHLTFLSNLYGGQKKGEEFPLFLGMISR